MTQPQFTTPKPPGASGPSNEELAGHLLILRFLEVERGITTTVGVSAAVRVNVVNLDDGEQHNDILIWGKVLVEQFGGMERGALCVGRVVKGMAQPGKSAPWTFLVGDSADEARAAAFLAGNRTMGAPAPVAPPVQAFTPPPVNIAAPTQPSFPTQPTMDDTPPW